MPACACACAQAEEGAEEQEEEDETARLFRLAAEQLREKREEEAMSVEERILKCAPSPALACSAGARPPWMTGSAHNARVLKGAWSFTYMALSNLHACSAGAGQFGRSDQP